jgi:virginiamycin B lyase
MKSLSSAVLAVLALFCLKADFTILPAHAQNSSALAGQVTSAEEGAMEGVLVSAKKGIVTVTVVSDAQGRFSFPAKLEPGQYAIKIRAIGYDLDRPMTVDVASGGPAQLDLKLRKTEDLAAQMSNAEWLASFPGTENQKNALLGCVGCHTLERVARSNHKSDEFIEITLPRMQGYVNQSIPEHPQLRKGERRMEERGDQRVAIYRGMADFLASVNLSSGAQWNYAFKTQPRPKGRATRVVITEYDLPRATIEPHDVVVDADGVAWYSSFGEQFLGRFDPKTLEHKEFPIKASKPEFPTGSLGLRQDKNGDLWLGNMYQAAIIKFEPKAEKFTYWSLPEEQNIDAAQVNMVSPQFSHVDGKVWAQNNGFAGVHRLDLASGRIETWEPFKDAPKGEPHNIYDVVPDSNNNVFFTDFRQKHIGRIDAKTGEVKLFPILTLLPALRRGQMDPQDRLWFGEYRGDKIGVFDTRREKFTEWAMPTRWTNPYDVALDKNEEAWTGSMLNDRVVRLNTKTGTSVEYLLPRSTNIRRVHVDNSTTPVTFWVGSNHGHSIVKLEPLD